MRTISVTVYKTRQSTGFATQLCLECKVMPLHCQRQAQSQKAPDTTTIHMIIYHIDPFYIILFLASA